MTNAAKCLWVALICAPALAVAIPICETAFLGQSKNILFVDVSPTTLDIARKLAARGDTIYLIKTGRYPEIVNAAAAQFPFAEAELMAIRPDYVVTGFDSGVELADALRAQFTPGLANTPELSRARRDKNVAYSTLAKLGIAVPNGTILSNPADTLKVAQELLSSAPKGPKGEPGRLIVKPPASSGSDLTFECQTAEQVEIAVRRVLGNANSHGVANPFALINQYVWGVEYASQFVTVADPRTGEIVHVPTDFWVYLRDQAPGGASRLDADYLLSYDDPAVPALLYNGRAILDGLGVRSGPSHLETKGGVLLDPNIRTCGAFLPQATERATGYGQIQGTVDAIHDPDRLLQRVNGYTVDRPTAIIFIRSLFKHGIFDDRAILEIIQRYQSQYGEDVVRNLSFSRTAGDRIDRETTDAKSTLGQMEVSHPDRRVIEMIRSEIRRAEEQGRVVAPIY
jgi:hypothetical protein